MASFFHYLLQIENMKSNKETSDKNSVEKVSDLRKETTANEPVQKGYNEKNPTQPQGAFKADSNKK